MDIDLLLSAAKADGLIISITSDEKIRIAGDKAVYLKWIDLIKKNREQISSFLEIDPVILPEESKFIIDLLKKGEKK